MSSPSKQRSNGAGKSSSSMALLGFFLLFALMLVGAFVRIGFYQTVEHHKLSNEARAQRLRQSTVPAKRGTIYDREGETLAVSVQSYNIIADPTLITRPYAAATFIARYLGGTANDYVAALRRNGTRRYSIVVKKADAQKTDALRTAIDKLELPAATAANYAAEKRYRDGLRALSYETCYKREYPGKTTASQVVGFVNTEGVGSAGLELYYDTLLKGTDGLTFSEEDVKGNAIPAGIQKSIAAKNGKDIILTIDKDVQFYAENQLRAAVKKYKGKAGSVIVMNPTDGELYAAASYPTYDANTYNKAKPTSIKNRALTDLYEPGSTMKCVTVSGALDQGAVTPKTGFTVPARLRVGTRTVRDSHAHATEHLTTSQVIEQSSNVGTTKIAYRMGKQGLYKTLRNFGFAERPGTDFPGATHGWLPEPANWADISLSNFSFGQGVSCTPVQMARAISAIADKGVLTTPHLLKDIPSDSRFSPTTTSRRVISTATAAQTTKIMQKVMTKGTGKSVKVKGYVVAGKTGTAQKALPGRGYVAGKYIGSFVGFLPADDPKLLVLVVIDEPSAAYYGSTVAGGAFANIAHFAATHLNIAPSKGVKMVKD